MWTFVGRKRRKVWLWLAVERGTRRIVAWVLGCRGQATAKRLWQALPRPYRTNTWYYTDEWDAYRGVLPPRTHQAHPKGSGQTSIVEAINCSLRQRCGVLVRRSCSFSRSLAMKYTDYNYLGSGEEFNLVSFDLFRRSHFTKRKVSRGLRISISFYDSAAWI